MRRLVGAALVVLCAGSVYQLAVAAKLLGQLDNRTQDRARVAHDILALAREDFRLEQYLSCMDRCEVLAVDFADLPEANEANQLAAVIKAGRALDDAGAECHGGRRGRVHAHVITVDGDAAPRPRHGGE